MIVVSKYLVWLLVFDRWGTPHLTREFFHEMGSKMGDQVLLIVAEDSEELVAGALNLIGGDTLFGRLWGCHPQTYYPFLHFEACYYQVHTSHYLSPQILLNYYILAGLWFYR